MAYAWKLLDHEGLNFLDEWKDNDVQDPDRIHSAGKPGALHCVKSGHFGLGF